MRKDEADKLKKVSMWLLKKRGFLRGFKNRPFEFHNPWTGAVSSIGLEVSTGDGRVHYVRFKYTYGDQSFDYKAFLDTTLCHYGGERYWFLCPFRKADGKQCKKRVGVLYLKGDYFACRHCHKLTYKTRNLSGKEKKLGTITPIAELERLHNDISHFYYNDRPTKKYERYVKRERRSMAALSGTLDIAEGRLQKVAKDSSGIELDSSEGSAIVRDEA